VSEQLAWEPTPEDVAFYDVYGDWDPLTPGELRDLMAGFPAAWWIVGGHAVEAFTGVRRFHEDIDLVVFDKDVPTLREHLGDKFHLWSNWGGTLRILDDDHLWSNWGGTLRILDDDHPEPLHPRSQIWMRKDARSPWRVDCILNPDRDGRWLSKRDDSHVADLEDVTWVAEDGIRYLNPEVTLLFKALQHRPKDEVDLDNVWPLLDGVQRAWLADAVRRTLPDHLWQSRLDAAD
jgi:hypothetical protein